MQTSRKLNKVSAQKVEQLLNHGQLGRRSDGGNLYLSITADGICLEICSANSSSWIARYADSVRRSLSTALCSTALMAGVTRIEIVAPIKCGYSLGGGSCLLLPSSTAR
jgi:hypothetical protein